MEGRQPKRRKDKYNPYEIYEKDGKYYVSFCNGEKEYKDLEIGKNVYEAFNTFELQDVSHMSCGQASGAVRSMGFQFV